MIFVTVGAQMPFDRLIRRVDEWAGERGRDDVYAQIGPSDYRAHNIETTRFLSPPEFRRRVESATAIVAHAGMGTIITALQLAKPLLVMPRLGELGETRNDHQTATARRFCESQRILASFTEADLLRLLDEVEAMSTDARISDRASPELLERVRRFTFGD